MIAMLRPLAAIALTCALVAPAFAISYEDHPRLARVEREQEAMVREAIRRGELTPLERRRIAFIDARNDHLIAQLEAFDDDGERRAFDALAEETALILELSDSRRDPAEGLVHRDDGGPAPLVRSIRR